jgi:hypothetical protein
MHVNVLDAIALVFDKTESLSPEVLERIARQPKRMAKIVRLAAKAIRDSAVERAVLELETEEEQRFFKALFQGQF